jgi:hypothetical protein
MSRVIEVLAADWEPFRRAFPGQPNQELAERALSRGRAIVAAPASRIEFPRGFTRPSASPGSERPWLGGRRAWPSTGSSS